MMKEALHYETLDENAVRCTLCNHRCKIREGKTGICAVRRNRDGKLYSLVYGKIISEHVDPIEKKPLFNFLPGSRAYSTGTVGCNFHCKHCQNSDISQFPQEHGGRIIGENRSPDEIIAAARNHSCETIAYTYNEPTVFYEFAYETAILAKKAGIKNVFVSNGYMSSEVTREMVPFLDGINIDLKAFSDKSYKEVCGARLAPVLQTIELMRNLGVWVEVTTLVIPGLNDGMEELRHIAEFVKKTGPEIPWHVTRFHPAYKFADRPPTSLATLRQARETGLEEGLRYVYTGNIYGEGGENTYCHFCGALLIERRGLQMKRNRLRQGRCPECEAKIDGVGL